MQDGCRNCVITSEKNLAYFNRNPKEFFRRFVTMDETWIHRYTPESRVGSKQWTIPCESALKRPKTQQSAVKVISASVFWDAHGVIFIDYLEKGKTITEAYHPASLDKLVDIIRKRRSHVKKKKIHFHDDNAPSYTLNIAQAKSMNWVSNRYRIYRIFQTWPSATIICSHTSRDGCVVGVLSRTKKLNWEQKGILEGLTNRNIWKAYFFERHFFCPKNEFLFTLSRQY